MINPITIAAHEIIRNVEVMAHTSASENVLFSGSLSIEYIHFIKLNALFLLCFLQKDGSTAMNLRVIDYFKPDLYGTRKGHLKVLF
jgi:hypothetical protein